MPPVSARTIAFAIVFALGVLVFKTPSFSFFSKTVTLGQNKISTTPLVFDLTTPQKSSESIKNLVDTNNFYGLYQITSSELKSSFTEEEFTTKFNAGGIKNMELVGTIIYLSSSWTKQEIKINYDDNSQKSFWMALKKEADGNWRLFGTEEK